MRSLREHIEEELRAITKYPGRRGIKLAKADGERILDCLNSMSDDQAIGLREYLTSVPALADERPEIKAVRGAIRAYNIVCDTPRKKILQRMYGDNIEYKLPETK